MNDVFQYNGGVIRLSQIAVISNTVNISNDSVRLVSGRVIITCGGATFQLPSDQADVLRSAFFKYHGVEDEELRKKLAV